MNKKLAIILSCIAGAAVVTGTTVGVMMYRGSDRRAVERGLRRLSEDMAVSAGEVISVSELTGIAEEVMYGDASVEVSANIVGVDAGDMISSSLIGSFISGHTDDVTIGVDASVDRSCESRKLSASGSLSVMNYTITDIGLYADGDVIYLDIPQMNDDMYRLDLSKLQAALSSSEMLEQVWDMLELPRGSVDLFPETESTDAWRVLGKVGDAAGLTDDTRDMWKAAEITRRDEKDLIESRHMLYECTVYDVVIDSEDAMPVLERMCGHEVSLDSDIELIIYIDENKDIRFIGTRSPVRMDGCLYGGQIEMRGAEVPIDEVYITTTSPRSLRMLIQRVDSERAEASAPEGTGSYNCKVVYGENTVSGKVDVAYERAPDELTLTYSVLKVLHDDTEIAASSGTVIISTQGVEAGAVPSKSYTSDFDEYVFGIIERVLNKFGGLLGLL